MKSGKPATLSDDTVVHRLGGKVLDNFQLQRSEEKLNPPGISVLVGGTAKDAARTMLAVYDDPVGYPDIHARSKRIASATIGEIRSQGFDVIANGTRRFPNHGRLIHPLGQEGFASERLNSLVVVFREEEYES